jgi:DNA-binding transcriptional LysR family regulator
LRLTTAGEKLFEFAEKSLTEVDRLETELHSYGKLKVTGTLTMGTYHSIAVYFVPRFFKYIRQQQNDLSVNLISASSDELVSALNEGGADFIVSIDPPKRSSLFQLPIMQDTYSLYRPVGFKDSLTQSILFTLPSAKDSKGKSLGAYVKEAGLASRLSTCGDFESTKAMVEQGVGYALLPDRVARPSVDAGRIELVTSTRKLNQIGPHWVVFSCRKHRAQDKAIKWVLDQLVTMLRSE